MRGGKRENGSGERGEKSARRREKRAGGPHHDRDDRGAGAEVGALIAFGQGSCAVEVERAAEFGGGELGGGLANEREREKKRQRERKRERGRREGGGLGLSEG